MSRTDVPVELATIPVRLKLARTASGLTQPELARLAGVSQANISRIENGKRLTEVAAATILRLARGLSVPVLWLMMGEGDRPVFRELAVDEVVTKREPLELDAVRPRDKAR